MPTASRTRRTRAAVLAPLVGLALVLAGCSSPGSVDDYNDETQTNFLNACTTANDQGLSDDEARQLCECWYGAITENLSFETFETAEDRIREGLEDGTLTDADSLESSTDVAVKRYVEVLNDSDCVEAGPRPG